MPSNKNSPQLRVRVSSIAITIQEKFWVWYCCSGVQCKKQRVSVMGQLTKTVEASWRPQWVWSRRARRAIYACVCTWTRLRVRSRTSKGSSPGRGICPTNLLRSGPFRKVLILKWKNKWNLVNGLVSASMYNFLHCSSRFRPSILPPIPSTLYFSIHPSILLSFLSPRHPFFPSSLPSFSNTNFHFYPIYLFFSP